MKIGAYTKRLLRKRKFIRAMIHFFIENDFFTNRNRFKVGDQVRYNWMAKKYIWSAINKKWNKTFVVTEVIHKGDNVSLNGEHGPSVFWLRPARKSERISVPAPESGEQDENI